MTGCARQAAVHSLKEIKTKTPIKLSVFRQYRSQPEEFIVSIALPPYRESRHWADLDCDVESGWPAVPLERRRMAFGQLNRDSLIECAELGATFPTWQT